MAKDNEQIAQKWLIYLAEEGYAATAVVLRDDVYLQMKNIISSLPKDIKPNTSFLAVDALSSAYVFSLRKNGYNYPAFVINPPLEWPLEELSPKHILQYYHIGDEPLIFFCDELSKEACNAAEELCCECSKQHLKCNVHMFHPSLIQGQILNFLETFYSQ